MVRAEVQKQGGEMVRVLGHMDEAAAVEWVQGRVTGQSPDSLARPERQCD
jgi:hypothetical protein